MIDFDPKQYWEKVYQTRKSTDVSWYQTFPKVSLDLIDSTGIGPNEKIIDIGGGASVLVDKVLERGFRDVTVLDISLKAIDYAKQRLGELAKNVHWLDGDIRDFEPSRLYDLWHDRAVFHFFTDPEDRKRYIEVMKRTVKPGGQVIMATFALEGPPQCSGLNVERYDSDKLAKELGGTFELIKSVEEEHLTPWTAEQKFIYCCFRKKTQPIKEISRHAKNE